MLIPLRRTVVTLDALAAALWSEWPEAEACDVAILFGKLVGECGWPSGHVPQACWCFNVGNIRGEFEGDFCILAGAWELARVGEVPRGARVLDPPPAGAYVPPGHVAYLLDASSQKFRAYPDLRTACRDYLSTMRARFPHALSELLADHSDPDRFVDALKADRYFTGEAGAYKRNVRAGYQYALPLCEVLRAQRADTLPAPAPELLSDLSLSSPATPLRAGEGEHTVTTEGDPLE